MFRFIALAWNPAKPTALEAAEPLATTWRTRGGWTTALHHPGLQVFVHGEVPGVNQAFMLPGDQGVVLGKIFRRSDLGTSPSRFASITDSEASNIVDSGGRALVDDFWGRYAVVFHMADGSSCVLRDPSGALPCYWIRLDDVAIAFSWLEDVLPMLEAHRRPQVNWEALTEQLLRGAMIGRETCLEGVMQVLPGERVNLHTGATTVLWSAVQHARAAARPGGTEVAQAAEAAVLLRQRVQDCTSAWASCYDTLMLRLSGGVDSSILLSCLAPARIHADVIGINYHSEGADSDERQYARLAAARVGRDLLERQRNGSFRIDSVLRIARMTDPVPYIGWMNAASDACLAAAHGAPAMFTGAGGDSVFFEFPRWWPAADYLHTRGLNTGFAAAAMDAARLGKQSIWRTIGLALTHRRGPSLAETNWMGHGSLLGAPLRARPGPSGRFQHPAEQEAQDLPVGKYMQTMALLYPLGYYDPFEQEAAPELVNPLLSTPLVELCLQLPTYLLTQGGRGRALARRAFAADLPAQVINRPTKGGMEEHINGVLASNIDFVRDMLLNGQLAARGLTDRARLEELLSGRPTAQASPTGQIHSLVAIEAWLARWAH